MKKVSLSFSALFLCTVMGAQDGFFKALPGYKTNQVIDYQDGYISIGAGSNPDNYYYSYLLKVRMDAQGNVLDTAHFTVNSDLSNHLEFQSHTMIKVGNEFIVAGHYGSNTMNNNGFLAWFNEDLSEIVNQTLYEFDHAAHFNSIIHPNDSTLIVNGYDASFGNIGFIMNTDMQGNLRWKTNLDCGSECKVRLKNTVQTSDGGYAALLEEKYDLGLGSDYWRKVKIVKLDEAGEIQWSFYLGNNDGYSLIPGGIIQTSSGTLIAVWSDPLIATENGSATLFVGNPEATIYIQEFSIAGITLNYKSFAEEIPIFLDENNINLDFVYYTGDIINTDDEKLLISGNMFAGPFLMKITEQGDLEWLNYYFPFLEYPVEVPPVGQYLVSNFGVNQTIDGGFVCSGMSLSEDSATGFVLKVGPDGCLWEGCETITEVGEFNKTLETYIYPNPTTDFAHMTFSQPTSGNLVIRNLAGQQVYSQNVQSQTELDLELTHLSPGIYLIQLQDDAGRMHTDKLIINP